MRFDLYEKVNSVLNEKGVDQSIGMPGVPYDIRAFLGNLAMFRGVPFYYLVPDEKYLPKISVPYEGTTIEQGSLKMFWLDKEWIECLMDGALSLGSEDDRQVLLAKAMAGNYVAEVYYNEVLEQIKKQITGLYSPDDFKTQLSNRLKNKGVVLNNGQATPTIAQNNWCYTGFLMRSAVISSWVGVEVTANGKDPNLDSKQKNEVRQLQVVRLERIAEDTLFCICEGIISRIEITQPAEAFHFGVSKDMEGKCFADSTEVPFKAMPGAIDINAFLQKANDGKTAGEKITDSARLAKKLYSKPLKIGLDITWDKE